MAPWWIFGGSEIAAPSTIVDPGAAWTVARRSRTAQFRSLRAARSVLSQAELAFTQIRSAGQALDRVLASAKDLLKSCEEHDAAVTARTQHIAHLDAQIVTRQGELADARARVLAAQEDAARQTAEADGRVKMALAAADEAERKTAEAQAALSSLVARLRS